MSMRLIVNLSLERVISSIYFVGNTVILDEHLCTGAGVYKPTFHVVADHS